MAMVWNAPIDADSAWSATRWQIAFDTGWVLDVIDNLPLAIVSEYLTVQDALSKAREHYAR